MLVEPVSAELANLVLAFVVMTSEQVVGAVDDMEAILNPIIDNLKNSENKEDRVKYMRIFRLLSGMKEIGIAAKPVRMVATSMFDEDVVPTVYKTPLDLAIKKGK